MLDDEWQTLDGSGAVARAAALTGLTQDAARDALRSALSTHADLRAMTEMVATARAARRSFVCVEMSQATMDALAASAPTVPDSTVRTNSILGLPIFIDDELPRGVVVPRTTYPARPTTVEGDQT